MCFSALIAVQAQTFVIGDLKYSVTDIENLEVSVSAYSSEIQGDVTIPESITYQSLQYSVTSIGRYAFIGCTGLTSITLPNSVTSIGDIAFRGCTGLTSITLPNSVTSIGVSAFNDCTGLTSINLPNSVTSIGDYTFSGCTGLTSITIPNSVTSIGRDAFNGCTGLASITLPNSVTSIGSYAFYHCKGLTSITIPNSVTSIGNYAFWDCTGLINFEVDENNSQFSSVDGVLFNKEKTELLEFPKGRKESEYILPNSVTSIGAFAFCDCTGLTSITLPNSVTSIGHSAFNGCTGLTSITLPNSITSIDSSAFSASGLRIISISNPVPPSVGNDAFNTEDEITVSVPINLVETYKAAQGWNELNIIGITPKHLANGTSTTTLNLGANTLSSIRFDIEAPEGVELNISEEAAAFMTITVNEMSGDKIRYEAITKDGKTLPVSFFATATAKDAKRGMLKITDIITSVNEVPVGISDIEIPVLGYALESLTLSEVAEGSETYLSVPAELEDIEDLTIEWMPYSSNFGTLTEDGLFTATAAGTISNLPLQINDPLVLAPLKATAILNIKSESSNVNSAYSETMNITTAHGRIFVTAPADSTVSVIDLQGRTLATWTGNGCASLPRGLYIVISTNCRPTKVEVK